MNESKVEVLNMKTYRSISRAAAGLCFLAAAGMVHAGNATNTAAGIQTLNWTAVPWDNGNPAPNAIGDIAGFVMNGNDTITLDASVILGRMYVNTVNAAASGNFLMSRSGGNTITFDNTSAGSPASVLLTRVTNDSLQRQLAPNLILNSDLIATWGRVQNRVQGLTGIISGAGRLSLNYAIAPTEGPDTGTSINLNGTGHIVHLGTAGDAPSTYTGGTDLRAGNATFTTVKFQAKKVDALGTGTTAGRLFMHQAALDLNAFNQTVGGLSGGANSTKINDFAGGAAAVGTTTLTLSFPSTQGPFTFSGAIQNTITGRFVALTKSGGGVQVLSGVNTYVGATTIHEGELIGVTGGACSNSAVALTPTNGTATLGVSVTDNTLSWTCAALTNSAGGTGILAFDFGCTVAPSVSLAPLQVRADVDFTAAAPEVTVSAGNLPVGSYPLLSSLGLFGTAPSVLTLPPHVAGSLVVSNATTLYLEVTTNLQPLTWTAGTGTWDIAGAVNWQDAAANPTNYLETTLPGDAVVFDDTPAGAGPFAVTLDTNVTPASVTVNAAKDYSLAGAGAIVGGCRLNKQGAGTLTLYGTNTYSGNTTVGGGTLQLGDGTSRSGVIAGNITNDGAVVFANPDAQTLAGVISGTGAVTKSAAGTLTLSGANSFGGVLSVLAGTLAVNTANNASVSGPLGNSAGAVVLGASGSTGTLRITAGAGLSTSTKPFTMSAGGAGAFQIDTASRTQVLSGAIDGDGALLKTGAGSLSLAGANTYAGGTVLSLGRLNLNHAQALGAGAGVVTIEGGVTIGSTAGGDITLTENNPQTWNGDFTFAGPRSVNLGAGEADLGAGARTVTVAAATLTVGGAITNSGSLIKAGTGTLALAGANAFGGGVTLNAGRLNLNHAQALGAGTGVFTINGGTLGNTLGSDVVLTENNPQVWNADVTFAGPNGLNLGAGAVDLGTSARTVTVSASALTVDGVISNSGALIKTGPGLLTLGATNTYGGDTTIAAGTLALGVGGSIAGSPTILLASGAVYDVSAASPYTLPAGQTLKGYGLVTGNLVVAGTVSPGASLGLLSFSNDLTFDAAGSVVMELDPAGTPMSNDQIVVAGALTYGGALVVTNHGLPPFLNESYPLFTAASYAGWFSSVTLPPLDPGFAWDTNWLATVGALEVYAFSCSTQAMATTKNTATNLPVADLLTNAVSTRSTTFALAAVDAVSAKTGSAAVVGGDIVYTPPTGFVGEDHFGCVVGDGHGSITGTVVVTVTDTGTPPPAAGGMRTAALSAGNVLISFTGTVGATYVLQTATNLLVPIPVTWQDLQTNVAAAPDGLILMTNAPTTNQTQFYRTVAP